MYPYESILSWLASKIAQPILNGIVSFLALSLPEKLFTLIFMVAIVCIGIVFFGKRFSY